MEVLSAQSNWKLTIERGENCITILRARTCDERAVLPDEIFGLPVTVLGDHAFAPDAKETQGKELELRDGRAEGDFSNRRLRELTLPSTLHKVEDYAFFNCRALESMHLGGDVSLWGSGVLTNCRSLARLTLNAGNCHGKMLSYFVEELSQDLDVTVLEHGRTFRLIFPEYFEEYEENCPAHHFDYTIYGAGYPYHHVFRDGTLHLGDYDALWQHFLEVGHSEDTAMRLAWWRIRCPIDLSSKSREQYLQFLAQDEHALADFVLAERDITGLRQLLSLKLLGVGALREALSLAREMKYTEAIALLLEQSRQYRIEDNLFAL